MAEKKPRRAYLYAAAEPNDEQKAKLLAFPGKRYSKAFALVFREDESITEGFRLVAGDDVYDRTREGRFHQLKERLRELVTAENDGQDVISLFKSSIDSWNVETLPAEEGKVLTVGDGIVVVEGLSKSVSGESLDFESGVRGMVQAIVTDSVEITLLAHD